MLGWFGRCKSRCIVSEIGKDDLQEASDIHAASFITPWSDATLAAMLKGEGMCGLVARDAAANPHPLIGFLIYRIVASEIEVITIATSPKARRRGAARALMEEMIRRMLADRLDEIYLEVEAANGAALALYRSLGFTQVGGRKSYYAGSDNSGLQAPVDGIPIENNAGSGSSGDALIMRLDLKN